MYLPLPSRPAGVSRQRLRILCLQHHRRVGTPAHEHLVAPVDRCFRSAPLVLCEDYNQLATRRPDAIGGTVTEVAQFPDRAAQLVDPCATGGLLGETHLFGAQGHPHALPDAEASLVIHQKLAVRFGAANADEAALAGAHRALDE